MKKRKALLFVMTLILITMSVLFTACEYGQPDKLNIGGIGVGERLLIGIQVAFIGMGMVFVVLFFLIAFIKFFEFLCQYLDGKKKITWFKKKGDNTKKENAELATTSSEDEEVAAAIMGALIAYYECENSVSELPFRVRSIKKINK